MKLSTVLECTTNLPDDQIEDGDNIIQPGGQGVACVVSNLLKEGGMSTSIPILDSEHGWEFTATGDGRNYWLLITDLADTKLIQTKDISPLFSRLFGGKGKYVAFLKDLDRSLSGDPRFLSVNWVSPK